MVSLAQVLTLLSTFLYEFKCNSQQTVLILVIIGCCKMFFFMILDYINWEVHSFNIFWLFLALVFLLNGGIFAYLSLDKCSEYEHKVMTRDLLFNVYFTLEYSLDLYVAIRRD